MHQPVMMASRPGNGDGIEDIETGVATRTRPRTKKPSNYGVAHNAFLEQEPGSKSYKTYDHENRFGILGSSRRPTLEGLATPLDKQSLMVDQIRQGPYLGIT